MSVEDFDSVLVELRTVFVGTLPVRLEALGSAVGSGADETALQLAHQLKGTAATYGLPDIARAASLLEEALRAPAGDREAALVEVAAAISATRG